MSPSARDCDDLRIADADPIGPDPLLSTVWAMNSANDTNGLVQLLTQVTPRADIAFRPHECAAAIRDLGVLAGSVKRLGVEPVVAVPELDRVLSTLGARTGMMPRNTLPHYTVWNPSGHRQRLYTGEYMERMLIASVNVTMARLAEAGEVCRRLIRMAPDRIEFTVAMNELVVLLRCLEDSMDIVMANVTPEFFALTCARTTRRSASEGATTAVRPPRTFRCISRISPCGRVITPTNTTDGSCWNGRDSACPGGRATDAPQDPRRTIDQARRAHHGRAHRSHPAVRTHHARTRGR